MPVISPMKRTHTVMSASTPSPAKFTSPAPKSPAWYHDPKKYRTAKNRDIKKLLGDTRPHAIKTLSLDPSSTEKAVRAAQSVYSKISSARRRRLFPAEIAGPNGSKVIVEKEDEIRVEQRHSHRFGIHRQPDGKNKSLFPKVGANGPYKEFKIPELKKGWEEYNKAHSTRMSFKDFLQLNTTP